ncbi:MAG: CheR family methyltransferase [Chloroflexota bacterium]
MSKISDNNETPTIPDVLQGIYGRYTKDDWARLVDEYPDASQEEIVKRLEGEPTCDFSFFLREQNIRAIPMILESEKYKDLHILSVGCGSGPEPFEMAMRLQTSGFLKFFITGLDAKQKSITDANSGTFTQKDDAFLIHDRSRYLIEMEEAGLLGSTSKRDASGKVDRTYSLNPQIADKLKFERYDIIDKPFVAKSKFDLIVCNNVLYHYPVGTRELMLQHILESMADGGKLILEKEEKGEYGLNGDRAAWLYPYYECKNVFGHFGLKPNKYPTDAWMFNDNFYEYDESQNQYKGKMFAIRDGIMVEKK